LMDSQVIGVTLRRGRQQVGKAVWRQPCIQASLVHQSLPGGDRIRLLGAGRTGSQDEAGDENDDAK